MLLGAVTAALGAALPLLRTAYGAGAGDAGGTEVVVAYNLGALTALLGAGLLERRLGGRPAVSWLLAAFAVGCAGMAAAPAWWVLTVCALVTGAGFGGLILHANTFFGRDGGPRSVRLLNGLHAAFGAGAVAGPLVVGETGAVRELLWAAAALTLCCHPFREAACGERPRPEPPAPLPAGPAQSGAPPTRGTPRAPASRGPAPSAPAPSPRAAAAPARTGPLAACALVAFLYAGVEAGTGALEATHLAAVGYAPEDAARLTALFWGGLTVGRLLLPALAGRVGGAVLVLAALLTGAAALAAATSGAFAPAAYGLAGVCLAGAFPTLLAWSVTVLPDSARRISGVLLTANLAGSAALPYALALLTGPAPPAAVPLALAALALASAAALAAAVRAAAVRAAAPAPGALPHRPHTRHSATRPDEMEHSA
ncbi:MFS transporter [Streptomyces sp. C8S0]|uniref:MFS transporter n=1 Tax=Streptomyces sp. C8S0 TaxID=2585716 RepID=UPI0018666CD4|nr:MFS transporter [Streptomyces sp. C8S0]